MREIKDYGNLVVYIYPVRQILIEKTYFSTFYKEKRIKKNTRITYKLGMENYKGYYTSNIYQGWFKTKVSFREIIRRWYTNKFPNYKNIINNFYGAELIYLSTRNGFEKFIKENNF